ncbi:signal transduction histidine kinase [Pedobacter sp. AK013]|uniref:sensor histidine kinase n=1 Tax=Pedobacter sp. AK013 TaxID=2723071 RepID=UPI001618CAF4|nr:ATP-binding protein [Pedobacter sp. AK013]MBB6237313.1 signal transduction histidine kinase [Pedobacter sp. AK013]
MPYLLRKRCLILILLVYVGVNSTHGQIRQIEQELQGLSSIKDSIALINSLNKLGTLYRTRNADSCFYYGVKAKDMAANIHYQKGQTEADHSIAFAFYKRGLYAESLELLGKILSQYQQLNDTEKIITIYLDMTAVMNKGISDRAKIISLLQKTIQMGKKLEKDSIMSKVYAHYCLRNPDLPQDSIQYYLDKSKEIANRYKDETMLIYNRLWQGRLLSSKGRLREALPLAKQALLDTKRIGNTDMLINALFLLTELNENNPKKALEYLYQAYEAAQKNGDSSLEIYILHNALEVAEQLGDKDEIIKVYFELDKSITAEWEKSKKFINDYVAYNAVRDQNKLLNEKNAQRTLWLIIISFSSAMIVLAIYLIMLRRDRKAKAQIEALNDMANMQIMSMEEAKHQAVREEQRRLGQELHDGLSSSIAAIKYQLEILMMDTSDIDLKKKLDMLQKEVENAYGAARNKSHKWFRAANEQQELSFEKQIKLLADSSLPDSRYNKTIQIDSDALIGVDMDIRIALLRIIQEAIINIIKHAKAKDVGILIYEEEDTLLLTINDDGIGLDEKKLRNGNQTIGLQSIRRRVQSLNGETKIHSDVKGTELIVSIPLIFS